MSMWCDTLPSWQQLEGRPCCANCGEARPPAASHPIHPFYSAALFSTHSTTHPAKLSRQL